MKKFLKLLGAAFVGVPVFAIGYMIFSQGPFVEQGETRYYYGGINAYDVQDWMIAQMGQSGTGLAIMAFGIVAFMIVMKQYKS